MKQQLNKLDDFLVRHANLWRPQPYKISRPQWCENYPHLSEAMLALSDADVEILEVNNELLIKFLCAYLPELSALNSLCAIPEADKPPASLNEAQFGWEMPGRKRLQIEAFTGAIGEVFMPVLEWCGGKGHLGRSLAILWQQPIDTVEWSAQLCDEGRRLASRANVKQIFHQVDALAEATINYATNRHAIALHACGDLHRQLIRGAVGKAATAIDISPCCYHLGRATNYSAFNSELKLQLSRDDLRLAVTNTGTASTAQLKLRDKEMAWKLGFEILRQTANNNDKYLNLKSIDKQWLKLDFSGFCLKLAEREKFEIGSTPDWDMLEAQGWHRQREVMRLNLMRFAFRRALETWLVLDMAHYLQLQGYSVALKIFCSPELTPRNILLSARL